MNSRSIYFNTDSFVKILLLTLTVHSPFYHTKHSHVTHVARYLPGMKDVSTHNQHNRKKYKNTNTVIPPTRQLQAASIL